MASQSRECVALYYKENHHTVLFTNVTKTHQNNNTCLRLRDFSIACMFLCKIDKWSAYACLQPWKHSLDVLCKNLQEMNRQICIWNLQVQKLELLRI